MAHVRRARAKNPSRKTRLSNLMDGPEKRELVRYLLYLRVQIEGEDFYSNKLY